MTSKTSLATRFSVGELWTISNLVSSECKEKDKLPYSSLVKIFKDIFPMGRVESYTKLVLRALDFEKKGFVSSGEMVGFLCTLARGEPKERSELAFRILDTRGQDRVGREDIKEVSL